MKKINTTEKGNVFEDKVFHFVNNAVKSGFFGIHSEKCKIYQKKGYFSKYRDDNIIFDISIEVFLFELIEWSLLFVFECKDYAKTIGVNEIEEFYAKVQQITGLNVKAYFVTNSKLQKSAFKYAKSRGITLIGSNAEDYSDETKFKPWILFVKFLSFLPFIFRPWFWAYFVNAATAPTPFCAAAVSQTTAPIAAASFVAFQNDTEKKIIELLLNSMKKEMRLVEVKKTSA